MTIQQHKQAVELYLSGMSLAKVGAAVGCSSTWVRRIVQQAGYETRSYSSTRTCRICGAPAEKRVISGTLRGARCRKHTLEAHTAAVRKFRRANPGYEKQRWAARKAQRTRAA